MSEITTPPTDRSVPVSLAIALVAVAGSVTLSVGLGLKACPLCFYQRTFAMGALAVLGIALLSGPRHRSAASALALPLAIAGTAVAVVHVALELGGRLECPRGLLGLGTAPQQSLLVLAALTASLGVGALRDVRAGEARRAGIAGAAVLGAVLAAACIASSPPMPAPPSKPHETPLEMCRPPFVP